MFVGIKKYNEALNGWNADQETLRKSVKHFDDMQTIKDREIQWLRSELNVANANTAEAQTRLSRIIASETPHMANIGKKLVDIAKGLR